MSNLLLTLEMWEENWIFQCDNIVNLGLKSNKDFNKKIWPSLHKVISMARDFKYYDNWQSADLKCPQCGWAGTFEQGDIGCYRELMDCSCPVCDTLLAVVSYPTTEESEANWDKLSEREKEEVIAHKRFLSDFESASLKPDDELPHLEGTSIIISWDFVEHASDCFTVLKCGEREIWREPAVYEGSTRFEEVVRILIIKYGARLADVVPTPASEYYLYGDDYHAPDAVQAIRTSIKESHRG